MKETMSIKNEYKLALKLSQKIFEKIGINTSGFTIATIITAVANTTDGSMFFFLSSTTCLLISLFSLKSLNEASIS